MNPTRYGRSPQQGNLDTFGVRISVGRPGMNGAGHVHEMLADGQSVRGQCAPKASLGRLRRWAFVPDVISHRAVSRGNRSLESGSIWTPKALSPIDVAR